MWPFGARIFGFGRGFGEGAGLPNPATEPKRSQNPKRPLPCSSPTELLPYFLIRSKHLPAASTRQSGLICPRFLWHMNCSSIWDRASFKNQKYENQANAFPHPAILGVGQFNGLPWLVRLGGPDAKLPGHAQYQTLRASAALAPVHPCPDGFTGWLSCEVWTDIPKSGNCSAGAVQPPLGLATFGGSSDRVAVARC